MLNYKINGKDIYDFDNKKIYLLKSEPSDEDQQIEDLIKLAETDETRNMPENIFLLKDNNQYWTSLKVQNEINKKVKVLEDLVRKEWKKQEKILKKIDETRVKDCEYWIEYNPQHDYKVMCDFFRERCFDAGSFYPNTMQRALRFSKYYYKKESFISGLTELLPFIRPIQGYKQFQCKSDEYQGIYHFGTNDEGKTWKILRQRYHRDWVEEKSYTLDEMIQWLEDHEVKGRTYYDENED